MQQAQKIGGLMYIENQMKACVSKSPLESYYSYTVFSYYCYQKLFCFYVTYRPIYFILLFFFHIIQDLLIICNTPTLIKQT